MVINVTSTSLKMHAGSAKTLFYVLTSKWLPHFVASDFAPTARARAAAGGSPNNSAILRDTVDDTVAAILRGVAPVACGNDGCHYFLGTNLPNRFT